MVALRAIGKFSPSEGGHIPIASGINDNFAQQSHRAKRGCGYHTAHHFTINNSSDDRGVEEHFRAGTARLLCQRLYLGFDIPFPHNPISARETDLIVDSVDPCDGLLRKTILVSTPIIVDPTIGGGAAQSRIHLDDEGSHSALSRSDGRDGTAGAPTNHQHIGFGKDGNRLRNGRHLQITTTLRGFRLSNFEGRWLGASRVHRAGF